MRLILQSKVAQLLCLSVDSKLNWAHFGAFGLKIFIRGKVIICVSRFSQETKSNFVNHLYDLLILALLMSLIVLSP